ncbi:extracellular solute-binding protein [Cohnella sp. GCM10020058]|uniref:extracellular solute-binding protein n=1 Tax=Cohnella sp. GCM10020058 TaxID=3317330 RepID=UPI00363F1746
MKKWLGGALALAVAGATLAACGSDNESASGGSQSTGTANAGKEIKLKFGIWGNETHSAMYEKMIEAYRTAHPNVSVEIMTIPFADYQQKMSIMMASKTAPDVLWLAERAIPQFMEAGQLADLSALKGDAGYEFGDLIPSTVDLVSKDGKLFGIPFSTPPGMIYYNKTLFKEKGLQTPTELYAEGRWTYEEMEKAAKAITDPSKGIYGVNLIRPNGWGASWIESLQTVVWAFGADYFSPDGKYSKLGLVDTHFPLTVPPILGAGGIFGVFLLRQFYITLPAELDEAAEIDGCSPLQTFWRIMVPLAAPAFATLSIFTFLNSWEDFLDPLIFLSSSAKFTLPVALKLFTDTAGTAWHLLMAASVMSTVPLLLVFFFAQRKFIDGIATTGLK